MEDIIIFSQPVEIGKDMFYFASPTLDLNPQNFIFESLTLAYDFLRLRVPNLCLLLKIWKIILFSPNLWK